jgi:hypothetical protein
MVSFFDTIITNTFGNVWLFVFVFIILIAVMVFLSRAGFAALGFIISAFLIFFVGQMVGRWWIGITAIIGGILAWVWFRKLFMKE